MRKRNLDRERESKRRHAEHRAAGYVRVWCVIYEVCGANTVGSGVWCRPRCTGCEPRPFDGWLLAFPASCAKVGHKFLAWCSHPKCKHRPT